MICEHGLLRKYFNALANLYGIIPVVKACEIISEQNLRLLRKDEFLAFAEIARHECEDYFPLGLDDYHAPMKSQAGGLLPSKEKDQQQIRTDPSSLSAQST